MYFSLFNFFIIVKQIGTDLISARSILVLFGLAELTNNTYPSNIEILVLDQIISIMDKVAMKNKS